MSGLRRRVSVDGRRSRRMTGDATRAVLAAIVDAPENHPAWGLSICESTGMGPAAVYPALDRLMKAGLIRDEWEAPVPVGRLRRRLYHGSYARFWYEANHLLEPRETTS